MNFLEIIYPNGKSGYIHKSSIENIWFESYSQEELAEMDFNQAEVDSVVQESKVFGNSKVKVAIVQFTAKCPLRSSERKPTRHFTSSFETRLSQVIIINQNLVSYISNKLFSQEL